MNCAEAASLLGQHPDSALPPDTAAALQAHLATCAHCQVLAQDFANEEAQMRALWSPVAAPAGFAARVVAALPPPAPTRVVWPRRFALVAALLAVLLGGAMTQGQVRASLALALQRVALRERTAPTVAPQTLPLTRLTLTEAQRLVPWHIRQPALPPGYTLVAVYAVEAYAFATGPTIILEYRAGDGPGARHLGIEQFQAVGMPAPADVAPGAARPLPVGTATGLLIEGRWIAGATGTPTWERGTFARLLIEDGDLVFQVEGDPREGWDAAQLAAVAASLR